MICGASSGSKLFDTLMLFLKDFSEKLILKKSADDKKKENYPACKELKRLNIFEPCHEKTNILVSDLVRHKPGCTATEDG